MKSKKAELIRAAIDLFAERGIGDVSMKMIAKKAKVSRTDTYYHFESGKNEIVDNILEMFDSIIASNMPCHAENPELSTDNILTLLFLAFYGEDAEQGRKINHIIFTNYGNDRKIGEYLAETFYYARENRFTQMFNLLIENGKIAPFDVNAASRILNRLFIAFVLEDTFTFGNGEYTIRLDRLKSDCAIILDSILHGRFHA